MQESELIIDQNVAAEVEELIPHHGIGIPRNRRGRLRWTQPGSTPEQNLQIGIRNIQDVFLDTYSEVDSLFPRNYQGMVAEELRQQAEGFILEKAQKDRKKMRKLLVRNGKQIYPEGYESFGYSFVFTLATSFQAWGLFEKEKKDFLEKSERLKLVREREKEAPKTIKLVNSSGEEVTLVPVNQIIGRDNLVKVLNQEKDFSTLPPIYITDIRIIRKRPTPTIYIGSTSGKFSISLNKETYDAYKQKGALILIPGEDPKFGYKWLDVYPIDSENKVDLASKVQSLRVNLETKRIQLSWFGPGIQALFDFINKKLNLKDPNDLPEFVVKTNKGGAYLGGGQNHAINFQVTQEMPSEVLIVPKYEYETGYLWLEGYSPRDKIHKNKLFTRRIINDEGSKSSIRIVEWEGPEIESLKEWAYGSLSTDKLKPVSVLLDLNRKHHHIYIDSQRLVLRLTTNEFDKTKPVVLTGKEDGSYKWIEVSQTNNEGVQKIISLARVSSENGQPKLISRWHGVERQLFVDFLDGIKEPSSLRPIEVKLNTGQVGHICNYHGKELKVALRSSGFRPYEQVVVVPQSYQNQCILQIYKEGRDAASAQSVFDQDSLSFKTTTLEEDRTYKPNGYWTPERVRDAALDYFNEFGEISYPTIAKKNSALAATLSKYPGGIKALRRDIGITNQLNTAGLFKDKEGIEWTIIFELVKTYNIDHSTLEKLLGDSDIQTQEGLGRNGQKVNFYRLDQAKKVIEAQLTVSTEISPEEANEQLRRLLEG